MFANSKITGLRFGILPLVIAMASAITFGGGSIALGQELTMRIAHVSTPTSTSHQGVLVWANYIETHSNGRIKVELFPGGTLGNFRQNIEQVQLGTLEVTFTSGGGIANLFPPIQAFDIPYLFPNDRVVEEVMFNQELVTELRKDILDATDTVRLIGLASTGGWRNFFTRDTPVQVASDLAGVKIRTVNSPVSVNLVEAFGGNPTPVGWPELYTAFSTGVVDGTKNALSDVLDRSFPDFLKYGVADQHAFMWAYWWANEDWWQTIPSDLQVVILDGFYDLQHTTNSLYKHRQLENTQLFMEAGGTLHIPTEDELATFRAGNAPVKEWYVENFGNKYLSILESAVERAQSNIAATNAENS